MKKILSTLTVASSLFIAANASAITLYDDGVEVSDGLTFTDLVNDGWSEVFNEFYSHGNSQQQILDIQAAAGDAFVFVGAINLAGDVIVGATGLASEVLSAGGDSSTAVLYSSSNLYWYNVNDLSFGFTPTENVSLSSADITGIWTADDGENDRRLSWHSHGDQGVGGWRAGAISNLNSSTDYRKIILVSDARVADASSTLVMLGLALGTVGFIRRRRA